MRPFWEEIYSPIGPYFPTAPRSQKAFSGRKYRFLLAGLLQSPCRSNCVLSQSLDYDIPKGEEADGGRELDANSTFASMVNQR